MWHGGVRVIVSDEEGRLLLVCQHHEDREIWMLPGGAIEEGENAVEASEREVLEETGLIVRADELIWHVEEVSPERGQRFVNYFLATVIGGSLCLGSDPEFSHEEQVLRNLRFMNRDEIKALPHVYPALLKDELWEILDARNRREMMVYEIFKIRTNSKNESIITNR